MSENQREVWTVDMHEADLDWSRQCSNHLLAAMDNFSGLWKGFDQRHNLHDLSFN